MNPRLRLILLSPAFRWAVVLLVLLVAGAVAFWPRQEQQPAAYQPAPAPPSTSQQHGPQPCPEPMATAAKPPLGETKAQCLDGGAQVDAAAVLAARDGRPTLVNVWASWCPPCRDELPVLQRYAEQDGAARVVGMQIDSPPADGLALLDKLGVRLPMLFDQGESVSAKLHVPYALPASYLIDTDGSVRFVAQPRVFRSVADVRAAVDRYTGAGHG